MELGAALQSDGLGGGWTRGAGDVVDDDDVVVCAADVGGFVGTETSDRNYAALMLVGCEQTIGCPSRG